MNQTLAEIFALDHLNAFADSPRIVTASRDDVPFPSERSTPERLSNLRGIGHIGSFPQSSALVFRI
jgi:hypothetical protein